MPPGNSITVSQLNERVLQTLEKQVGQVLVTGEVSGVKTQPRAVYFTLKDANAAVSCVWFRPNIPLSEGMAVEVNGIVSLYQPRGTYQLRVNGVSAGGQGLLYAKFEALKRRLETEGLFARERKRRIPAIPATVALITSSTGAVIQDMLNILSRRAPYVRLLLFPCKVQGDGAAEDVAAAIAHANEVSGRSTPVIDTLIVGRGGGSLEDLWAFNEEVVARAIAASTIPVISAVGHETDTTIADFVADLRAPTPSAAAERVARDQSEIESFVTGAAQWMRQRLTSNLDRLKDRVKILGLSRLFDMPRQRIQEEQQRLDLIASHLTQSATQSVRSKIQRIEILRETVARHRPDQQIAARRQHIQSNHETLRRTALHRLETLRHQLTAKDALLKVLSPDSTMERGFSITLGNDGKVIRTPGDAPSGTRLRTLLKSGVIRSTVDEEIEGA